MSQLSDVYKTYSVTALLRIIENPENYRPEAVKTARDELDARDLSPDDIGKARAELEAQQQELALEKEHREEIKNTLKEKGSGIIDYINPIQDNEGDAHKSPRLINTIAIIFLAIGLLQIITQFDLITGLFQDTRWDFSVVIFLFPVIITPLAAILFWMKKTAGWILLSIYLSFALMGLLWMFFIAYNPTFLIGSLFFSGTLWTISQERIRSVFKISTDTMYASVIASILIVGAILGIYFFVL
ncbi:hypothetical protein [uncultured Dysgonomonas sp.]|uniref:Uncharacterized protein n=1 Tax=uncultured Dysgonomonas sp. TaxID=206096 RepID=A0A212K6P8_9BACT|nr:hypothetical protein [uncultured Dysgonomonas sp.]SBW07346.1 conserved membrane hypothetical protein [uncultured Dysgonomonas sp.]